MTVHGWITQRSTVGPECASFEHVIREHLERLLRSGYFDASSRSREFLAFVVNEMLAGRGAQLNQTSIAQAVFGRSGDFDAVLDPIVRVQAGRLRRSLERYYLLTGRNEAYRIELPKGSYVPSFTLQEIGPSAPQPFKQAAMPAERPADGPEVLIHSFAVDSSLDDASGVRLTDELTTELCRYGDVHVIRQIDTDTPDPRARAAISFELRGTLRHSGDDCLIGARLIDRSTGQQLWSDEFHTSARAGRWSGSVLDIARVMAARIGSENGVIANALAAEYAAGRLDPSTPTGAIARCYHFFHSRQVPDLVPLFKSLEQLTARAPEFGLAWVYLARLCVANHSFELSPLQTPMNRAIPCAYQGVLLDPASARARCILATALILEGEVNAALDELEQALRLNPDSLAYREINGWLTALAGEWERGIAIMRESMERNPYFLPHVNHGLWADHLRRGEFEAAHRAALEYRDSAFFWRDLMIACSRGLLGRTTEARANVAELLQAKPHFRERGRTLIGHYIKPVELRELVVEGLAKADLVLS
jgi:adenylate cyclase